MNPAPSPSVPSVSVDRFSSPLLRLVLLGLLLLALLIPCGMIENVVQERDARRQEAVTDITGKWGGAQTLVGPILRVPFLTRATRMNEQGKSVEAVTADVAYFLPRDLRIRAQTAAESRQRGIFSVPVYVAKVLIEGRFDAPEFSAWGLRPEDVDWARAELILSLSEPRGLHGDAALTWEGRDLAWKPSSGQHGSWSPPGIHAALGTEPGLHLAQGGEFRIAFSVNGSEALSFAPTAEQTTLTLTANWPHPSFQGSWLPVERDLKPDGFSARWSVSYLGRNFPQRWRQSAEVAQALSGASFGVKLATPVDHYQLATRITKYAVMTLVFTFAVIWLTEVLSTKRAHLIQYGFTGAALCLFGLLQLSFAEHFGFNAAFALAAAAVLCVVGLYMRAVLRSARQALNVVGVLALLYGYVYLILQAEDYALMGGSLALFAGLAVAMYLTRKVDWFALGPQRGEVAKSA